MVASGGHGDGDNAEKRPTPDPTYSGAKAGTAGYEFVGIAGGEFIGPGSPAMSAALARNWWVVAVRAVLTIIFGIIAVLMPGVTLGALVLLFAAYMLADGIFDLIAGIRAVSQHRRWGALILEGICDLIASAIAFFWPLATVLAFTILMGVWAIFSGASLLAGAVQLRVPHGRWLMGFGSIVSIIWGVLLLIWPFTGALVLTWWMGGYALFFGGALLVLAFRLRRHRHEAPPAALPQNA